MTGPTASPDTLDPGASAAVTAPEPGATPGPEPGAGAETGADPTTGAALDAIQPHPGRPVAWPPQKDERGLAAPYPPGGIDPAPESGLAEERHYLKLLVAMILAIVIGSFAIGIIGLLLGFQGGPG